MIPKTLWKSTLKILDGCNASLIRTSWGLLRYSVLNQVTKHMRQITMSCLKDTHKEHRIKWAREYMKTVFSTILASDVPEKWSRSWVAIGRLIFFTDWDVNKVTAEKYIYFLKAHIELWFKKSKTFRKMILYTTILC